MKKQILLYTLLFFIVGIVSAQENFFEDDTTFTTDEALLLIRKADSIRMADSLQKVLLMKQIEELAQTETVKRKELEDQLNALSVRDSLQRVNMRKEIDSLKNVAKAYPVIPYKDTIFFIHTKIGMITASERAKIVNERIKNLYKEFIVKIDSLHIVDYGQSVDIVFHDKSIMSITEYDAIWFEKSKHEIALHHKELIYNDLVFYKENTSFLKVLKQIGLAVLVIVLQVVFVRLVNLLFRRKIDVFIANQKGKRLKGLKIKDYQFLDDEKETAAALFISKITRWFVILLLLYLTLPILFSIFPPTRRLAETLFGYVLDPAKSIAWAFVNYLPNLFAIIVIVIITRYVLKFLKFIAGEIESENLKIPGFYPDWTKPTFNIIRFLILAFMFVIIFPYLPGSDSPIFQGVSVFLGIVFSLGSSSVIGNMIAGLVMTYMRPFQIGDRIRVGEVFGDVLEKTAFVTRIKTPKNEYITVPNSTVLSASVTNYSTAARNEGIILHTTITIGYDVPWDKVHQLLSKAALQTEYVLEKPSPFVLQTSLDDFYVSYQINIYTLEVAKQAVIYSGLHRNIQDCFNEAGVEILSPHYRGQRDGNMTTTPAKYLPDDYHSPTFRVENIKNQTHKED